MKLLLVIFVLCTSISSIAAQTIKGDVRDSTGNTISHALVLLCNSADSTHINGTLTDLKGEFSLSVPDDKQYLLYVSYLGYKSIYCPAKEVQTITMEKDNIVIDQVVVQGNSIKQNAKGYSIGLLNSPLSKGKQAHEVMSFLPGVTYKDDEIQVLQRATHAIYIDGVKIIDISELQSIPAEMISKVEIDYTADVSEGSDAQGGVIRITL